MPSERRGPSTWPRGPSDLRQTRRMELAQRVVRRALRGLGADAGQHRDRTGVLRELGTERSDHAALVFPEGALLAGARGRAAHRGVQMTKTLFHASSITAAKPHAIGGRRDGPCGLLPS